jgi:NDP-sugar pyrophosphorylase family protein
LKLLILAGGFGTRLQHLGLGLPKALVPVAASPFLELQLQNWLKQGITSFVFLLHHQADRITQYLHIAQHGLLSGCDLSIVVEKTALDTGGAIANAVKELSLTGDFLVTNADTWLDAGIADLQKVSSPAIAVLHVAKGDRFGSVDFDDKHAVTGFKEKDPFRTECWISAGMYRLNASLFAAWGGDRVSVERDLFPLLLEKKHLRAVKIQSNFIDIGVPEDYHRFCRWIQDGRSYSL